MLKGACLPTALPLPLKKGSSASPDAWQLYSQATPVFLDGKVARQRPAVIAHKQSFRK
jgi:hypothetical protein